MDKKTIRQQTGDFLDNLALNTTNNFGLGVERQYLSTVKNQYSSENVVPAVAVEDQALTSAREAIIPMQIAVPDRDGNRLEFVLLINPETWNQGKTNSYKTAYTRSGWMNQLWGPNMDTISSTGRSAGSMVPLIGLDNYLQGMSFSYLNLTALLAAYRTNGYQFFDLFAAGQATRVINLVSGVQICYDNNIMTGHFNNFTLDENAEQPYIFNYNFEFIVSSLSGSDTEIRGHYKHLPMSKTNLTSGTAGDPETITTLSDVAMIFKSDETTPQVPPKPSDDRATERLWTKKTGLPYSEAFSRGLTDGSVQGSLHLRSQLISKTWNPNTGTFS